MSRTQVLIVVGLAWLLIAAGCGGGGGATETTLRVGVLPILDTLPLFVAEQQGLYDRHGVSIDFVSAASAAERDQLLQAGEVDVVITDLVALALYNRDEARVVAVRYAMTPTPTFAQFRVLGALGAGIDDPEELARVPIGVSEGTVIEYVTDRMLEAEGLAPEEVETLAVPKIPERMALLRSGELMAATLPEPLASLAMQDGAVVVVDDTQHIQTSCSVYAVRRAVLEAQPEAVRGLLRAISEASRSINDDKARWSGLLVERALVPQPLIGEYDLPDYPGDRPPSQGQFNDAVAWLRETGRLAQGPAYEDAVDAAFLP